ncbi:MAG: 23S rRNA (pseudouridine(1915)-N(3))-methyltransferase RlmH [Hyphomicrobiaceae bacterium]|nr:23S rRNA (pseudouridine(1915)-N(3))-methyltransferase RlmH [Hyphomicrobiaceae bacterium]
MRLMIAAIGRLKDSGETALVSRYAKRIDQAGRSVALAPVAITELTESRASTTAERKADEAQRLITASSSAERRIVLDEGGRQFSSEGFANVLRDMRDAGVRELAFIIGGPDGHGDVARQGADTVLSLGQMTLPHGLARIVLLEQIYRAVTIIAGHPYHRS